MSQIPSATTPFSTKNLAEKAVLFGMLLAVASPATAKVSPVHNGDRRVAVTGLDLADPGDVAILRRRVDLAVRAACGLPTGRTLADHRRVTRCREQLAAEAAPQIDAMVQRHRAAHGTADAAPQA